MDLALKWLDDLRASIILFNDTCKLSIHLLFTLFNDDKASYGLLYIYIYIYIYIIYNNLKGMRI